MPDLDARVRELEDTVARLKSTLRGMGWYLGVGNIFVAPTPKEQTKAEARLQELEDERAKLIEECAPLSPIDLIRLLRAQNAELKEQLAQLQVKPTHATAQRRILISLSEHKDPAFYNQNSPEVHAEAMQACEDKKWVTWTSRRGWILTIAGKKELQRVFAKVATRRVT